MTEEEAGTLTVIPAVFEHGCTIYAAMQENATPPSKDENLPEGKLVYEGHLTRLFKALKMPVPYYTLIKNQLVEMGCIEQIRRGGGTGTSRWVLWKEPTLAEWKAIDGKKARRGNITQQNSQQIRMLNERVTLLETKLDRLLAILQERRAA